MALEYAHGVVQWNQSDTAGTNKVVSIGFQGKAFKFETIGIASATDATTAGGSAQDMRLCEGFAVGTSDRRVVFSQDQDTAGTMACVTGYRTDAIAAVYDYASPNPAVDGLLDLSAIGSTDFTLTVDDQLSSTAGMGSLTVKYEVWGGSDFTLGVVGEISEPAATGNQDYTVTGFTSGATDQAVIFAGVQGTAAANTATRNDSGIFLGYATGTSAAENIVMLANQDDGSASSDTDSYALDGECLAMTTVAGGNPNARATLTQWNTNGFRLNWIARGVTNRKTIFLAMKGGRWKAGSLTIDTQTLNSTATVSSLAFAPIGLSLISQENVENTAGTSVAGFIWYTGCGTGTSSRRAWTIFCSDGTASSDVNQWIEYDQVLVGGASTYDISAMNPDGFQLICDDNDAGEPTNTWIGYFTFGSAAFTPMPFPDPPRVVQPRWSAATLMAAPPSQTDTQPQNVNWWSRNVAPWRQPPVIRHERSVPSEAAFQAPSVNWWTPAPPAQPRRPPSPPSVMVKPSIQTDTQPQDVKWWPGNVAPAPTVWPRRSVKADVPVSRDSLGWWTESRDPGKRLIVTRSEFARPFTTGEGWPLTLRADGIPPVSGRPSVIVYPLRDLAVQDVYGWWTLPPDLVKRLPPVASLKAVPIRPLDADFRSDLTWLPEFPARPWPRRAVLSVKAQPDREPDPAGVTLGWWTLPRDLVRSRQTAPILKAVPIRPLDPDFRSELPWLPEFPARQWPRRSMPSVKAQPDREPDPAGVTFGWWPPGTRLVLARHPVQGSRVVVTPVVSEGADFSQPVRIVPPRMRVDSRLVQPARVEDSTAWLTRSPAVIVPPRVLQHVLVKPLVTAGDGRSDLPWLPEFPARPWAPRSSRSVYAFPLRDPSLFSQPGVILLEWSNSGLILNWSNDPILLAWANDQTRLTWANDPLSLEWDNDLILLEWDFDDE